MIKENLRVQILNGSLQDYKHHLAGCYKGFYITVTFSSPYYSVRINASPKNDATDTELHTFLEEFKHSHKHLSKAEILKHSILLTITSPNLRKNLSDVLNEIMKPVIDKLIDCAYISGCENCGSDANIPECYEINGTYHYLCSSCVHEVDKSLYENQQISKAQKSNLFAGLIGAFLGALLGCVLWIAIYRLGYIAGIAGAVIGICAMKGYEMLGKHLDKKGVIGCVVVMAAMIYFANRISWAWEAYSALGEYGYTFTECYRYLSEIIEASELTGAYFGDLAIGYVLTALSSFRHIKAAFQTSSGSYTFRKADK